MRKNESFFWLKLENIVYNSVAGFFFLPVLKRKILAFAEIALKQTGDEKCLNKKVMRNDKRKRTTRYQQNESNNMLFAFNNFIFLNT